MVKESMCQLLKHQNLVRGASAAAETTEPEGASAVKVQPGGRRAREAVERSRQEVARAIGARPEEIMFTGSATEANNTVLKGVAWHFGKGHLIASAVEHPAVLQPLSFLLSEGFAVTLVPVDGEGRVDPDEVRRALRPDTILISIMHGPGSRGVVPHRRGSESGQDSC